MLMFPVSLVNRFEDSDEYEGFKSGNGTRLGQAFHNFAKLHQVTTAADKAFCDKLWNADNSKAADLIVSRIDDSQ